MQREYKNIIFTEHALERLQLRRITQDMIVETIRKPDDQKEEDDGDIKFIKTIKQRPVHVVSKYLTDEKKWLVKSAWVRGEDDSLLLKLFYWGLKLIKTLLNNSSSKR